MNHRYTLCCHPGHLFRSGRHFLILDRWLSDDCTLILAHGILSEDEYRNIKQQEKVPIYQGVSFAWIGLYPAHESKKYTETQFAGYLRRKSEYEFSGYLHIG